KSIGGWICAVMALLGSTRMGGLIIVDGVGIEVPGHPVVDFFSLTMDQVADLSYHRPDSFRIDPSKMPPAQQAAMAGNRAALAVYGGAMVDPPCADASERSRYRRWCCGGKAIGSPTPTMAAPLPTPSPPPGSSCSAKPATSPRSKALRRSCRRYRAFAAKRYSSLRDSGSLR